MKRVFKLILFLLISILSFSFLVSNSCALAENDKYVLLTFDGELVEGTDNKIKITVDISQNPGFNSAQFNLKYNREYLKLYNYELVTGSLPNLTQILSPADGLMTTQGYPTIVEAIKEWNKEVDEGTWTNGGKEESDDFIFIYAGNDTNKQNDSYTGNIAYLYFEIKDLNVTFEDKIYYQVEEISDKDGKTIEGYTDYAVIRNEKNKPITIITQEEEEKEKDTKNVATVAIVTSSLVGASILGYVVTKLIKKALVKAGKKTLTKL